MNVANITATPMFGVLHLYPKDGSRRLLPFATFSRLVQQYCCTHIGVGPVNLSEDFHSFLQFLQPIASALPQLGSNL